MASRAGYYTATSASSSTATSAARSARAGWAEWHGSKQTYRFYGYELLENGERVAYGSNDEDPDDPAQPQNYSTTSTPTRRCS